MSFLVPQLTAFLLLTAIVVGVIAVGWAREASIQNWRVAATRFILDYPEYEPAFGIVSKDSKVALFDLRDGVKSYLGIVTVLGDKLVSRFVSAREVKMILTKKGLRLYFSEPMLPPVNVLLDPNQAVQWLNFYESVSEHKYGSI